MLIVGIGLFNLGADLAMTPMGTNVGSFLVIAVLLSVIREDCVDTVMNLLEEKFATIRNGKGIAFAVPMSSVIGVNLYQFLSNNRQGRGMQP